MRQGIKVLTMALLVFVVALQSWTFSEFVVLKPGIARPAGDLGSIVGASPSQEKLLYTAVIAQRANVLDRIRAVFDKDVRLTPRSENIPGGVGWREYSQLLAKSMSESQKVAAAVAFREAGYRVPAQTTVVVDMALPKDRYRGLIVDGSALISVNDTAVRTAEAAYELLRKAESKGAARLVLRSPDAALATIEVAGDPSDGDDLPYGLVLRTEYTFSFPMEFVPTAAEASGSSAGLMLAIELYDQLTGGKLVRSGLIAGTGAIRVDGAVEAVDGIPQKVIAARRIGATAFVLPRENLAQAIEVAGGITLIPVDTFAQAIEALRWLEGEE